MEFTLLCPNDGEVALGLEDISVVAFSGSESVDIEFVCPRCGASIRARMQVPNILRAALEIAPFVNDGADVHPPVVPDYFAEYQEPAEQRIERERVEESYCEYFRRQLARVECVEDLLIEIDSR